MVFFDLPGSAFQKPDDRLTPLICALILGEMTEIALRQRRIMPHGSPTLFFSFFFLPAFFLLLTRIRCRVAPQKV